jgi:hypothetical protein
MSRTTKLGFNVIIAINDKAPHGEIGDRLGAFRAQEPLQGTPGIVG